MKGVTEMANDRQPAVCPRDPVWIRRMLEILPPGLRGKLEPFASCPGIGQELVKEQEQGDVLHPVVRP